MRERKDLEIMREMNAIGGYLYCGGCATAGKFREGRKRGGLLRY